MTAPSLLVSHRPAHLLTWIEVLISSLLGLIASLVLSVDAIVLAANPDAVFSCDISAKISCGTVGQSWQSHLLGENFPNAFLGLVCEPVIITVAVASLAGVRFPRWFMLAAHGVAAIGFVFAYWLFTQAYFVIGALCPWCLLITVTTTLIFFAFTRVNITDGAIPLPGRARPAVLTLYRLGGDIGVALILLAVLAAMVITRYL